MRIRKVNRYLRFLKCWTLNYCTFSRHATCYRCKFLLKTTRGLIHYRLSKSVYCIKKKKRTEYKKMGIENRVALVTGATSKIGQSYVKYLLLNRAKVWNYIAYAGYYLTIYHCFYFAKWKFSKTHRWFFATCTWTNVDP